MIQIKFTPFIGIGEDLLSEPSGIAQLTDGRLVIVNDTSAEKALFVAEMGVNGKLHSKMLDFPDSPELDDLEGVALSGDWIYVISSHSAVDDDDSNARRIARFQLIGDSVVDLQDAKGAEHLKNRCKHALQAKYPELDDEDFADEEFNIEALANQGDEFLIGLRSPVVDGKAMVVSTYNLRRAYGANPQHYGVFADSIPLNLKSGGIRALSYIPDLQGYLIVSGKTVSGQEDFECESQLVKFILWFWDGKDQCKQVACFDLEQDGVKIQPEGICATTVDDLQTICIVSDDGDEDNQIPGRYSLLTGTQYQELKNLIRQSSKSG